MVSAAAGLPRGVGVTGGTGPRLGRTARLGEGGLGAAPRACLQPLPSREPNSSSPGCPHQGNAEAHLVVPGPSPLFGALVSVWKVGQQPPAG